MITVRHHPRRSTAHDRERVPVAHDLQRRAERAGEGQIAGVMEETERLLLRFAAAPDAEAKHELDGLRQKVDSRDLLFRLQVMEARVEKREKDITPTSSSKSSL